MLCLLSSWWSVFASSLLSIFPLLALLCLVWLAVASVACLLPGHSALRACFFSFYIYFGTLLLLVAVFSLTFLSSACAQGTGFSVGAAPGATLSPYGNLGNAVGSNGSEATTSLLDAVLEQTAASSGSPTPLLNQVLAAMDAEASAAAAAGGAEAAGAAITLGTVGLVAGGAAVAGSVVCVALTSCVTFAKSLLPTGGLFSGAPSYTPDLWSGMYFSGAWCSNGGHGTFCGPDPASVGEAIYQAALGGTWTCSIDSNTGSVAQVTCTGPSGFGPYTVSISKEGYGAPPLTCADAYTFIVPTGTSGTGQLTCAMQAPPADQPQVLTPSVTVFSTPSPAAMSAAASEPVDPQFIANIANALQSDLEGAPTSAFPGGASGGSMQFPTGNPVGAQKPPNPVTAAQVALMEAETGIFPSVADLFNQAPTAEQPLVVFNPATGTYTSSPSIASPPIGSSPGFTNATGTNLANAQPCGNVAAGEQPCSDYMDFTFNPETGSWEWMGDAPTIYNSRQGTTLPAVPNTTILQQTQTEIATDTVTLPDMQIGTLTKSNPYTDPKTQVQTITEPLSPSIVTTTTDVAPDNLPPIVLPLNEWPQVFQDLNNLPDLSGSCPTVSFYSSIFKTTFTISSQCLVMDAMQPYMQFVLPPTYLFLGLLFLMAA